MDLLRVSSLEGASLTVLDSLLGQYEAKVMSIVTTES